jgi:hypothetical protein
MIVLARPSSNLTDRPTFQAVEKVKTQFEPGETRGGRQPARTCAAEHGSRGIYSIGSRSQATSSEDIANGEDLVRVVANCKKCE